mmetsp:Transcript_15627/g.27417  ORF Transcript_15627/g.27417 Transcript_15627/m.27417 type:complete len:305 (-) Transcript_15627:374-1288(-)|eukprot:CAMPEP_0184701532 /NCGR_PEP_ID=MMETSP0313-20130426/20306_1 /TAXON_ID=2792 /ORGANISM="Porphyridium aerugineum, Strain SAG 1380-2" /LENGTH=304 /DNA_ID=CAMNT_0027161627 /DNA_START=78 /DNA_END=992 /DNA_ORIENTATION=-
MNSTARQAPLVCPGHNRGIVELQYSAEVDDGLFMISACHDGKPMLRNGTTGDWIGTFEGHKGAVWGACLNYDASVAATGAADFTARVWDAFTGDCKQIFQMKHICKSVALSDDSRNLLAAGNMPGISIFDLEKTDKPPTVLEGGSKTTKLARYVDGKSDVIVSAGGDPCLFLWDVRAGKVQQKINVGSEVRSGEMSRDGSFLTIVTGDDKLHCFDMKKLASIKEMLLPAGTESASVHVEKNRVVCGGRDLQVYVFDYQTGNQIESYKGHHGPVWVLRFAPAGNTFSSGADDGTIRIWQTPASKS